MKTWSVCLPITGKLYVEVEADDEESAIEEAFNSQETNRDNIEEWEIHRIICQGNVFYGMQNEASADCVDDGE